MCKTIVLQAVTDPSPTASMVKNVGGQKLQFSDRQMQCPDRVDKDAQNFNFVF